MIITVLTHTVHYLYACVSSNSANRTIEITFCLIVSATY